MRETVLARMAGWCYERRRRVVVLWIAALVAASVLAAVAGGENETEFRTPGTESTAALELLEERLPDRAGGSVDVVYRADGGVDDPAVARRVAAMTTDLAAADHVVAVEPGPVSPDGRTAMLTVRLDQANEQVPVAATARIMAIAAGAAGDDLAVETGGWAVQSAEGDESSSEGIGLLAAALILLLAFGSLLAMGLPIAIAVFALGVALAGIALIANVLEVPDFAVMLATMIGIGVGIDYSLFVLNRFRTALGSGAEPAAAVVEAVTTAGRAVVFAGTTVVIALFGLVFMGLDYLWGVAAATSLAVLVVMVASLTLLPALLGFAGRSIDRLRLPWLRGDDGRERTLAWRWSRAVQRRPWVWAATALVVLLALTAPVTGLRFGMPDAGNGPDDLTSRRAYDLVTDGFGAGANGPLAVAARLPADGDAAERAVDRLSTALAATDGVAAVHPAVGDDTGSIAVLTVVPATGPQEPETEALVRRLRDDVIPTALAGTGADAAVGGQTAMFIDESDFMAGRLPFFIAAVITMSFLLLLVVFRSVLVAVKAATMNLLSIGAAYGVIALAAHGGWFGELIGIEEATPVPVWLPMMMFALLFGLSMDYEVFLLSRVREEYLRTGDNASAVADGLAGTARVITAAAAIMVTVFGAFILEDQAISKLAGLGMATAIFVDATVVRMVLVPSTMELLGDRNWWLPGWLDRLLPQVAVEGGREPQPVAVTDPALERLAA